MVLKANDRRTSCPCHDEFHGPRSDYVRQKGFGYPLCCSSPSGGAKTYQLLQRSINRQVSNRVAKNDTNFALSPTFRYVSIESLL
ncbi:hypothetical protein TNCV_1496261 [Trichonephila clavipes]|nr:hypothetical protein TNCV_1496261 [Trichonephila clavipes]